MNKFPFILVFALLSLSAFVYAQETDSKGVEVKVNDVKEVITANDVAEFDIIISNGVAKDIDFFVAKNFYSEKWRVTADPYLVSVSSGSSKSTRLHVSPTKFLTPADYKIIVIVESRDKSFSKEVALDVKLIPFAENNIKTELIMDNKLDPRLEGVARVSLESLYNFDVDNVNLVFDSELFLFERDFNLKPNEKRVEAFQLKFDNDVELGNYEFKVTVEAGGYVLGRDREKVTLTPYSEVTERVFKSNNFNKKVLIARENTGTEQSKEEVVLELTLIEKILARFNVVPDSIENIDGKYIARWSFLLEPGDRKDIVVTVPYGTYLLILLVVAALTYIVFYITKRKVVLIKKVIDVTKDKDGIRGVKIILHLENKGNKGIEKIRVIDYIPKLAAASNQDFGSMSPTRVQKGVDGRVRLVWDFDGLGRKEERIVSYIAKSNLSIIGKLLLPEAVVEYQVGRKLYHIKSNRLTILMKTSEKERKSS